MDSARLWRRSWTTFGSRLANQLLVRIRSVALPVRPILVVEVLVRRSITEQDHPASGSPLVTWLDLVICERPNIVKINVGSIIPLSWAIARGTLYSREGALVAASASHFVHVQVGPVTTAVTSYTESVGLVLRSQQIIWVFFDFIVQRGPCVGIFLMKMHDGLIHGYPIYECL